MKTEQKRAQWTRWARESAGEAVEPDWLSQPGGTIAKPLGTRVVSLQGRPLRCGARQVRQPGARRAPEQHRARLTGSSNQGKTLPGARCPCPGVAREIHHRPASAYLPCAASPYPNVMLECNLWKTTSADAKLRLRAMDLLRERKTVNVSWWGRP